MKTFYVLVHTQINIHDVIYWFNKISPVFKVVIKMEKNSITCVTSQFKTRK